MRRRHHLPRIWLMTDERMGDACAAITALPPGSGIIFRHYATPATERRALFDRVRRLARRRRHWLMLADRPQVARAWGADGAHHRSRLASCGLRSVAVHNRAERVLAERVGADMILVSPVFVTRSHPGTRPLGPVRFGLLVRGAPTPVVALGGMTKRRFRTLRSLHIHGWAAIDGLGPSADQNLNAVPM